MTMQRRIISACFDASPVVRYVAAYLNGKLELQSRPDLQLLGSNESDRYEELIVNPTMLKLLAQRGDIDCGGCRYVLVGYGSFDAFVYPVPGGHVTVSLEQEIDFVPCVEALADVIDALVGPAQAPREEGQ